MAGFFGAQRFYGVVDLDIGKASVAGFMWWRAANSSIEATVAGLPTGEPPIDL